ncbi:MULTISPECIES: hypothetical protein [Lysobacter]|uniref:Uncharacterized protein n=1 Tax=Lysobacter gummosus TaxID=262324 RepID=A0ABY3XIE4_9GAMM|nr:MULTISPECIES: hypothetical protein [Lysobacter]ALN90976.1 hypothetical protein LG3211_2007 [Lysobacter gummosus]UJB17310.1 hypothetical protein L1A79_13015 [Lysobacter capsici]UJQ28967.1 hypothetical protein L2D09_01850 [Lysobacter gummosus]UNP31417.1 hypothetical protein MOV92_09320 [Lysobacter gummosus]
MYVLSEQLDADGDPRLPFERYAQYLRHNRERFPASAHAIASGPLLDVSDPRCPHDAWLEWARFEEPSQGERHEIRELNLRVRLLSAQHDRFIELFYPRVHAYTLSNPCSTAGHFDWRYSEIRLTAAGTVVHEIEWAGPPGTQARWLIEALDVRMETFPLYRAEPASQSQPADGAA